MQKTFTLFIVSGVIILAVFVGVTVNPHWRSAVQELPYVFRGFPTSTSQLTWMLNDQQTESDDSLSLNSDYTKLLAAETKTYISKYGVSFSYPCTQLCRNEGVGTPTHWFTEEDVSIPIDYGFSIHVYVFDQRSVVRWNEYVENFNPADAGEGEPPARNYFDSSEMKQYLAYQPGQFIAFDMTHSRHTSTLFEIIQIGDHKALKTNSRWQTGGDYFEYYLWLKDDAWVYIVENYNITGGPRENPPERFDVWNKIEQSILDSFVFEK